MCESLQSPSSQTSNADVATAPPSPPLIIPPPPPSPPPSPPPPISKIEASTPSPSPPPSPQPSTSPTRFNPFAAFTLESKPLPAPPSPPPSPTLTKDDFTPLENESPVIQAEVIEKWLSLSDPTASVTIRRFQTLVAARLHARVQESSVRVAMKNLIISEGVHFDVQTFATIEEDTLTELVQNIHFWRR